MKKLFITIFALMLITPYVVKADGGMFPPPDRYVYEAEQKAAIYYQDGVETMVLSVKFYGNAYDFGWIVPTPNYPEVSKSSDELFTALDEFTEVKYPYRVFLPSALEGDYGATKQGVEILETKKVDYYDVTILKASDASSLTNWLQKNNYDFPKAASYLLQDYIDNKWYFSCFKIDTAALGYSKISEELRQGHATPVQFQFVSDKIIFPMKISGVMGQYDYTAKRLIYPEYYQPPSDISVLLYIFADHRQTIPGFSTDYAGWVKKETIKKFAYVDNEAWLTPKEDKYFLTRLYQTMSVASIKDDLVLRQAESDDLVNADPLQDNANAGFWVVVGLGSALTLGLIIALVFFQIKKS